MKKLSKDPRVIDNVRVGDIVQVQAREEKITKVIPDSHCMAGNRLIEFHDIEGVYI